MKNVIIKTRYTQEDLIWVILFLGGLIYGITQIKYFFYFAFLLFAVTILHGIIYRRNVNKPIIDIMICTLLLPDNYTIVIVAFILAIKKIFTHKYKINQIMPFVFLLFLSISALINLLIGSIHIPNVIVSVVYLLPFFSFAIFFNDVFRSDGIESDYIISRLKCFLSLQYLTVIVWAITHIKTVMNYADLDWVTGTLGTYQCNVLMCLCVFSGIVFLCQFYYYKTSTSLLWAILSVVLAICTGAFLYTFILLVTIFLTIIIDKNIKLKMKLTLLLISFVIIGAFFVFSPKWMVEEVHELFQWSYLQQRVVKLRYYYNTFVQYPKNEGVLRFLFGIGAGEYTSRAAETCAGGYVSLFDGFFGGSLNPIREKYILSIMYSYSGAGLSSTPQASIISITGEFGLIGLIFLVGFFVKKYIHQNTFSKMAILYFFGLLFVDNALEFAKYGLALWVAYYCCIMIEKNYSARRYNYESNKKAVDCNGMLQCRKNNF